MAVEERKTPRFWVAMQPSIIRLYKIAGLVALTAILIGLIGFLIVNIFYFFDHTWVRPVVLGPGHPKVIEASNALNDAKSRQLQLAAEKLDIEAQLAEIDRTIAIDDKFIADVGTLVDAPKTPEQWLVHRQLEQAKLEKDNQLGKKAPLKARLDALPSRVKDEEAQVHRLEQSPYLKALNNTITLAFMPLANESNDKPGTKLYACRWGLVMCSKVGVIKGALDGEVQDIHPHDESVQRGIYLEIELTTPSAANENVLFAGGKPLWLF